MNDETQPTEKNVHAVTLGKLRKGCKERKSKRKGITSRRNGKLGGRPKKEIFSGEL